MKTIIQSIFLVTVLASVSSYADSRNDSIVSTISCSASTLFYGATDIYRTPAVGLRKSFAATAISKLEYNSESDQISPKPLFSLIAWNGKLQLTVNSSSIAKVPVTARIKIIPGQPIALEVGEIPQTFLVECVVF